MGMSGMGVLGAGLSCSRGDAGATEGTIEGATEGAIEGADCSQDGVGGKQLGFGGPQVGSGFGAGLAAILQAGIHLCTGCTCDATFAGGAKRIVTCFAGAGI